MTDHTPDAAMLAKAETLTEALPYMQRYAGKTFVVKYGGHAMGDPELQRDFAEDVVLLKAVGINPVVVHGGGPQIGSMLKRLGVESRFVDGLRVTDAETARIAEMVLAGSINKEIVGWIGQAGGRAVGISGKDAGLVQAEKVGRKTPDQLQGIERHVDLGFVGEPVAVDRSIIDTLSAAGIIPVIAPIAIGADGHTYNINADTMAGAIAAEMRASRFFLLTDVAGVLDKQGELLTDLDPAAIAELRADGTITGGMIPKLETCVAAVEAGVDAAVILDGRVPHAMLLEIFTRQGAGTLVRR
ncbi:acetylglutamate kinase [Sphingomonas sp. Leaf17]|uniref:acetylglutamate kinase n=1 Tax=Sphingomonas sp. Leaf17 TaxID=1735683 RepID=UPI0006FDE20B|nr:acetylglutamate kinase [Sphingomonas sp. Leaf17]KQM67598.1 acetylglutamate kinase [Sphingomonas sp. Leaf17]